MSEFDAISAVGGGGIAYLLIMINQTLTKMGYDVNSIKETILTGGKNDINKQN